MVKDEQPVGLCTSCQRLKDIPSIKNDKMTNKAWQVALALSSFNGRKWERYVKPERYITHGMDFL